jgi:hypothetical protein
MLQANTEMCVNQWEEENITDVNSVNQPRGEYIASDPKGIPPTPESGTLSFEPYDAGEVYGNKRSAIIKVWGLFEHHQIPIQPKSPEDWSLKHLEWFLSSGKDMINMIS